MCGIAGLIISGGRDHGGRVLRDMAKAIVHRGPDDQGFFETVLADEKYVGLAHQRLSIIDLDTGHQPMTNEDGTVHIVFNGEIYNFVELRAMLVARGHSFATKSDTEVIIHAYEEYGDACVERLRGMFAFALWDAGRQRLLLARDRFGKKPLVYSHNGNSLLFASEIGALLRVPGLDRSIDLAGLWDYFAYRYVPAPLTLLAGIKKLLPGHYMVWQRGRLSEHRYYTPPDERPLEGPSPAQPLQPFLAKLDEAVQVRLVSDVPFGAFLSGGLDSSAIVALMSRHLSTPVKTFSIGFHTEGYDELGPARLIANAFNTEHHELEISERELMANMPALVRNRGAPLVEPSDIPLYLLAREARRSVKMVLTGEGADEILGGYPKHVFERYASLYSLVPDVVHRHFIDPAVHALPYAFRRVKTAIASLGQKEFADRMPRWFGAMSLRDRESFFDIAPAQRVNGHHLKPSTRNSSLRRTLFFDQTSWLPDNLLERADIMTMAASLEARMPFMDHELAELVATLPDRYRVRGMTTKWILRRAMRNVLPAETLHRRKVGFRVPVNEWFRGAMKEYVYDHLAAPSSRTRSYCKRAELDRVLGEHMRGRQNHEKLLWSLLSLEIWHRELGVP